MLNVPWKPVHLWGLLTEKERLREHHHVLHPREIYLDRVKLFGFWIFVQEDCTLATLSDETLEDVSSIAQSLRCLLFRVFHTY